MLPLFVDGQDDDGNIYDTQGTILYRILTKSEYLEECAAAGSSLLPANTDDAVASLDSKKFTRALTEKNKVTGREKSQQNPPSAAISPLSQATHNFTSASALADHVGGSRMSSIPVNMQQQDVASNHSGVFGTFPSNANPKAVLDALEMLLPPVVLDNANQPYTPTREEEQKLTHDGSRERSSIITTKGKRSQGNKKTIASNLTRSSVNSSSVTLAPCQSTAPSSKALLRVAARDHVSRVDVVKLFEHLKRRCTEGHVRPRGTLCRLREHIFDDAMKELTRQTTILCPERGLLLNELCQQMKHSTETYEMLYESACQYAVRKATERNLQSHLFVEKEALESEVRRVENRVNELQAKYDGMVKRFKEQMVAAQQAHEDDIKYVKRSNQQIVTEIKRLASMESASKQGLY